MLDLSINNIKIFIEKKLKNYDRMDQIKIVSEIIIYLSKKHREIKKRRK